MITTPVIGFAAYSGTGKTTLLEAVIVQLKAAGVDVAVIKHSHHPIDPDPPGKDSHRFRQAGARRVLLATPDRDILVSERRGRGDGRLDEALALLATEPCDLVLVEGFRHDPIDKIEIVRSALGQPWLQRDDPHVIAIASDAPAPADARLPWLDLNAPCQVVDFICRRYRLARETEGEDRSGGNSLTPP